jgi:hypothetical protein
VDAATPEGVDATPGVDTAAPDVEAALPLPVFFLAGTVFLLTISSSSKVRLFQIPERLVQFQMRKCEYEYASPVPNGQ